MLLTIAPWGNSEATLRGIEHACTRSAPPGAGAGTLSVIDSDLHREVVGKIEAYAADAAPDQQLAGRELAPMLGLSGKAVADLSGVLTQSLPNLKVCGRRET